MSRESSRTRRVADQIQRDLASILQMEVRDPRVGMVTVNEVKISPDLGYADVYVTFMGIEETAKAYDNAISLLNQASGYIRSCLGKMLRLRITPALRFHYDESLARGRNLSQLIDKAVREGEKTSLPASDKPETKPFDARVIKDHDKT